MLSDKNAIMQVLGSLIKQPYLLAETDKVNLTPDDFDTSFEKYIFSAIYNLYQNGAKTINVVDIDNYLASHAAAHIVFEKERGIEYLQDAEDLCQLDNFFYYYGRLKKFNLLKELKKMGFKTSHIYSEDLVDEKSTEINEKFETYSLEDVLNIIKKDIGRVESKFSINANTTTSNAADNIRELVDQLKTTPEIGAQVQGEIFNTVVRGARKGKYYLRSSGTGTGKTRSAVGDACYIAYPIRFNSETMCWENNGDCEKVLFIATEQNKEEIQTLILSYLADINEEKILYGNYSDNERNRIDKAIDVMNYFHDNFIIVTMPDPSIAQVKSIVRGAYLLNGVENVFYDYIFSSPSLLNEFRDLKIREDVILMMFSTALKELATELNIFVMSSTQISGENDGKRGIKNQQYIRGAKAIADKVDVGCIVSEVTQEELNLLGATISQFGIQPNQVTDVYKLRRGRWKNTRIWSHVDLGTCRKEDLFITNGNFEGIQDFTPIHFVFNNNNIGVIDNLLSQLNDEVPEKNQKETIVIVPVISLDDIAPPSNKKKDDWDLLL